MSRVPGFAARFLLVCLLLGAAGIAAAQPAPRLVPLPRSMAVQPGHLTVTAATPVVADGPARGAASRFVELLRRTTGIAPRLGAGAAAGAIRFRTVAGMAPESYRLEVDGSGATISASDRAGLFYGGVTLWQLLTEAPARHGRLDAQAVRIEDGPRFGWRGLMLDSARHFQSPAFILHLIDWMAVNKLNRLHWHLTDDQGWRIEIRRYPRLTSIGGWRRPAAAPGAPPLPRIGGYYSQAEIRRIVAYARARAIEIVPEIEMPGHALAAIRAYPELGTGVAPPPGIESDWGIFPYLYNVDEPTFAFIRNVLDEVLALFPGTYVHVGGDEAVKDQWRASPQVQARMRALGIRDEEALQGWFTARIGRFLESRGRRLLGWDEILQGGLPANATVMSWRGIEGAVAAARAGHDAVLSPAPILYFDNRQGTSAAEPPGRGNLVPLADVYAFEPAPATLTGAEQAHVLGLQANLWTEHIRTEARAAYMAFPRAIAVAERGWSAPGTRDFRDFATRLAPQLARLGALGLAPAPSAFRPEEAMRFDPAANRVSVALSNQAGSEIRYTLDGSAPTASAPLYVAPLDLALPARLRARGFLGGEALPGELDRLYDPASVRRRDIGTLKLCSAAIPLALEDDAPAAGPRATFFIDVMHPCWLYEAAPLDGIAAIEIEVGQLPFNFQIGRDVEHIRFRPPATAAGEVEVRAGGCDGERIATLPLAPAAPNPAVTRLRAPIAPRHGSADLCLTYTARGPNPLWAIRSVQLVQRR
ncbi:MAG: family 20 glycosylhydrolase [Sphingomonadaceae bacterium]|nr:family 20 glycosylhydrolase [Sphingomonadaceae bacterium]